MRQRLPAWWRFQGQVASESPDEEAGHSLNPPAWKSDVERHSAVSRHVSRTGSLGLANSFGN